jgi:hypothetical protein
MREHSQNSNTLETMTDMPQPSMNGLNGNGNVTTATGLTNKSSYGSGGSAVHSYEVRACAVAACWRFVCTAMACAAD